MDFPSIWKAASIALTGAFGILGLLTEFKDKKTHKITRWGYISLGGICVSTVLGITAQVLETSSDSKRAAENSHRAVALAEKIDQNLQKTDQTLHGIGTLAQKSDTTLDDVERLLTPLQEPEITIAFAIPCRENRFRGWCNHLEGLPRVVIGSTEVQTNLFSTWPKVNQHITSDAPVAVNAYLSIHKNLASKEEMASELYATSTGDDPDRDHAEPAKLVLNRVPALGETLWILKHSLKVEINRGTIDSIRDLKGALLIVAEFPGGETLPPVYVAIESKNGLVATTLKCNEMGKSSLRNPPVALWPDDDPSRIFGCAF